MLRKSYFGGAASLATAILLSVAVAPTVSAVVHPAVTGGVIDVGDPDVYTCPTAGGFVGFEDVPADTTLSEGFIPGIDFSSSGAFDWTVGDFGTGDDAGTKFPAGVLTSEQTHFASTKVGGSGSTSTRIDLTNGPASTFSILVKDSLTVTLVAHQLNGSVLKTEHGKSTNGRHMIQMQINDPAARIAFLTLSVPAGADFALDSVCTDAPTVPTAQVRLSKADGAPGSNIAVTGFGFGRNETVDISINGCFNGSVNTNGSGTFILPMTICSTVSAGPATITATGEASAISGTANYLVHTDWPQLGFSPERSAFNQREKTLTPENVGGLHQVWAAPTGGRATTADIVQGIVYTSSANNEVFAINEQTGKTLWFFPTNGTLRAAPAVDGNRVFVASGDGHVYALDAATGAPVWAKPYPAGTSLNRAPLFIGGVLYFGADNGNVYALNEKTGKQIWKLPLNTPVHSTLATDGTRLFVGTDSGTLYAINRKTQAKEWQGVTGGRIRSSPAVVKGGNVFVGSDDGFVWAWRASDGHPEWSVNTHLPVGAPPAVGQGLVVVGDEHGNVLMLSQSDGTLVHSYDTGSSITSRAAIANGIAYVGSSSQSLYAISMSTGESLLDPPLHVGLSPTEVSIANGGVYVGSDDHVLYKFGLGAPQ